MSLLALSERVGQALVEHGLMLTTAESCTGGWVAQVITAVPGSSRWFERGFVTYSNASKVEMLGVSPQTLRDHGAVSGQTAREMAGGALRHSGAHVALAITGIAGPGGATADKPVGTVWFAWLRQGRDTRVHRACFAGDRQQVREQAVHQALQGVLDELNVG